MLYTPLCVRIIQGTEIHCVSGVSFVQQALDITVEYNIVVNHVPITEKYESWISSSHLIKDSNVRWIKAKLVREVEVFNDRNDSLQALLEFFVSNGFNLLPNELYNLGLKGISLAFFEVNHGHIHTLIGLENYRPIRFTSGNVSDPIVIESYPFNLTNPILFSSFRSHGHINYRVGESGYLSDIKYLENMSGGIVNRGDEDSVGLVLTQLKKLNGDGDLTVILSWTKIAELLKDSQLTIRVEKDNLSLLSRLLVLPVLVKGLTWGSCVVYNESTLITNTHVVRPLLDENCQCLVFVTPSDVITVKSTDIVTPYDELDLSFIKLSEEHQNLLKTHELKPVEKTLRQPATGDEVSTVGYGLFLNKRSVDPIKCTGNVSTTISLPFYEDSSPKGPVLIITSSSCWNGSSGGALMLENKFLGIICSNATVRLPDLEKTGIDKLEKLSKFCLVLPAQLIDDIYARLSKSPTLNKKIKLLWNLESFHNDVLVERDYKL